MILPEIVKNYCQKNLKNYISKSFLKVSNLGLTYNHAHSEKIFM